MAEPSNQQIEAALEEVLRWPKIARSPMLAQFLSYIVLAKLRGDEAGIKAYSIAVDVFGRAPSFDPQSDPIVRVQARRLRGLLEAYYRQGQGSSPVRIDLPVGHYVPEFALIGEVAQPAPVSADAGPGEALGPTGRSALPPSMQLRRLTRPQPQS